MTQCEPSTSFPSYWTPTPPPPASEPNYYHANGGWEHVLSKPRPDDDSNPSSTQHSHTHCALTHTLIKGILGHNTEGVAHFINELRYLAWRCVCVCLRCACECATVHGCWFDIDAIERTGECVRVFRFFLCMIVQCDGKHLRRSTRCLNSDLWYFLFHS